MPAPTIISPSLSIPRNCWRGCARCCAAPPASPPPISRSARLRIDTRASRVTLDGNPVKLTSLEYRLLAYLAHHRGKVVSRTELVEHLYDQDFDRDSNTIEVFIGRLRKKLDAGLIQTVRGLGYQPGRSRTWRHSSSRLKSRLIAGRALIAAAAIWTMLGLAVGGLVLSNAFRMAAQNNFDAALAGRHGRADRRRRARSEWRRDAGRTVFVNRQFRPRLFRALLPDQAGAAGQTAQISRSLFDQGDHARRPDDQGRAHLGLCAVGPENQHLRVLSRRVEFLIARRPDQVTASLYLPGRGRPGGGGCGRAAPSTAP